MYRYGESVYGKSDIASIVWISNMDGKGALGNGATFDLHNNYIAKVQLKNASLVMCVENNRVCV
jgi:hypothetical protein